MAKLQVTKPAFIYENNGVVGVAANILMCTAVLSSTFEEKRREREQASILLLSRQLLQEKVAFGLGPSGAGSGNQLRARVEDGGDPAGGSGLMAGAQGGSSPMGLSCSLPQLK